MTYTVTIPGEPMGKGRPRVTKNGTYTPEKTANYENLIKVLAYQQRGVGELLEGPLRMRVVAVCTIPKSASKKMKLEMLAGTVRPTKKPDYDNVGKICGDALNGIWYKDDSQIVDGHVMKYYGAKAFVEIEVGELCSTATR